MKFCFFALTESVGAQPSDVFIPLKAVPVDMFPYCAHVETVLYLERYAPETHDALFSEFSEHHVFGGCLLDFRRIIVSTKVLYRNI